MTAPQVKEMFSENGIQCDMLSKNRNGNYVLRKGFFYTHGNSSDKIAEKIVSKFPKIKIVDTWDKWVAFKGGHTLKQGSHFGVEFYFTNTK
jgi:hypothetical protein